MMYRESKLVVVVAVAMSFVAMAGCESAPSTKKELLFFPPPPANPRIQFLTWASGAEEVEPARGGFEDFVLGEEPKARRIIQKPYGVAVRDGVIYVCDTKGLNLTRLDFRDRRYSVLGIGGPGRLRKPINIAIDPLGYKFVVDADRKQVVVFGPDDEYVNAFDVPPPCHPVDIAIHGEDLYVLDNDETCQIVVMDRTTGVVSRTMGEAGGEPGQFKIPNSIAISPDGHLYVSDTHNWRIQKLTLEGKSVWAKGQPGYRLGQFGRPRGIRIGPDGIVYVVDAATEIVQMLDGDGQTLMRFGGPGDKPGALGLPSTLAIDTASIPHFQKYAHKDFKIDYLMFVASQFGKYLINVYAFGSFPDGFSLEEHEIQRLTPIPMDEGIGPVNEDDSEAEPLKTENPHERGG